MFYKANGDRQRLLIKIKSLAAESKIISKELKKYDCRGMIFVVLHYHRLHVVRKETRSALLAYGYLRGKKYSTIEYNSKNGIDTDRVFSLVKKYGTDNSIKRLDKWFQEITAT